MRIDAVDLRIIRRIENHGVPDRTVLARRLELPEEMVAERLRRLRKGGVIKGFGVSFFYPPLLGGEWYWALAQIEAAAPLEHLRHQLGKVLPHITDIAQHRSLPVGYCPNVTTLFYSQDPKRDLLLLKRVRAVQYVELYRISRFSFPVKRELSKIEWSILTTLYRNPDVDPSELAEHAKLSEREAAAKKANLLWDEENKTGIALILPNLDWTRVSNFMHVHVGLETSLTEGKLVRLLKSRGIDTVPYTPWFKKKYFQIERDIWALEQFVELFNLLGKIKKLTVMGVVMAKDVRIVSPGISRATLPP